MSKGYVDLYVIASRFLTDMVISPVHFPSYRFWPRNKRGGSFFDSVFYFRRGSWALAYGLMALAKKRGKEKIRVWFPDYFCCEPFEIIKEFPIEIVFYPITQKCTPDWATLRQMANRGTPDALVLVHYFGFSNDLIGATTFCQEYQIDLVEDCAHVMEPFGVVGISGAFSIWSPWKFFPLLELGMLWVRDDLRDCVEILPPFREVLPLLRWWTKREVQRIACWLGVNWYKKREKRSYGGHFIELQKKASPNIHCIHLFQAYLCNANFIRTRRIENYKTLASFFQLKYFEVVLHSIVPEGVIPYAFPFVISRSALEFSRTLIDRGIPAFPWPELPDEVKRDRAQYRWANFYAEHLLLLPVHQSVTARQVEYMKMHLAAIW